MLSRDALLDASRVADLIGARIETLEAIKGALPRYLELIEAAAQGAEVCSPDVLEATGLILDNLYRGVLSPRATVPRDFWATPLGLAIARAHTHAVPAEAVVSQAEAADWLGVSREYVSQLVESGKARTIVREAAAVRSKLRPREMLYRESLAELKLALRREAVKK